MFSNNLVTLIVNSQMIAGRSKSTYLQKILCTLEMQNTFSEREREREEKKRERKRAICKDIHVSAFVA